MADATPVGGPISEPPSDPERLARRTFLKTLGQASVAAPAATLLLAAAAQMAFADGPGLYGCHREGPDSDSEADSSPSPDTDCDSDSEGPPGIPT